jgi:membrane-associated phospholipid phosphatase
MPALIYFGHLKNIKNDERRERMLPLFFTAICFYLGYHIISKFSPSSVINLFMFSSIMLVIAVLCISFFWKISMHMTGIGGVTGLIMILLQIYKADLIFILCVAILIAGTIATSRLALRSHTPLQLVAGYFLGILVVFGIMFQNGH